MFMLKLIRNRRRRSDFTSIDPRVRVAAIESLERRTLLTALAWSNGPSLPAALGNAAPLSNANGLFVLGGTTSTGASSSSVYSYDPVAGQWTTAPALDQGRSGAGV